MDAGHLTETDTKKLRTYLYSEGSEPFFSRKKGRDTRFLEALDSQLSRIRKEVWSAEGCARSLIDAPISPLGAINQWKELPHAFDTPVDRHALFMEAVNFLSPQNSAGIERRCERLGSALQSEGAKRAGTLLLEEDLYQYNPHKLVALYQLIGLYLNWKATPQEIAKDIFENFPETKLAELKQFRQDVQAEGGRFSEVARDMAWLSSDCI